MAAPRVKAEPGVKLEPGIKAEHDDAPSPMSEGFADDDDNGGDLKFYDPADTNDGAVYLTHVPKYLYDAWEHMDDDAEIQIGTLRQWTDIGPNGEPKDRIAILLDHTLAPHQQIPKEYNLEVKDMNLTNTFLFTEKDTEGYKSKNQGATNIPHYLRPKAPRPEKTEADGDNKRPRKGRYQPYYRKAIPKETTLAGRFRHELNCQPAWTSETRHWLNIRNNDAMKPKATTTLTSANKPVGVIQAGSHVSNDKFSNFVRTDTKKTVKKAKGEKFARLPKGDLRDRIFECFERYNYWGMRAFRNELQQPEAWLRENLEEVAILHKTGPFAGQWELNSDHKGLLSITRGEGVAPEVAPEDESESDEEMEDVLPA
ncbi:hypothetical protein M426DRAFT_324622 [Hypoxylon sp. CI-4A]|nr:hypothetical protein M426DRAFT_324622 [Hypoxylon sp. CI-4A]